MPDENVEFLKVDENQGKESLLDRIKYKTFWRHHTDSILFDESGSALRGKQDIFSKEFQAISRTAEKIPDSITQGLGYIGASIFNKIVYEKEDGSIGFKLPFSQKEENKVYKDSSLKVKCGDLLNEFVDKFKDRAKTIEAYFRTGRDNYSDLNGKNGYLDLLLAATNNKSYNMNEFENVISAFRREQNYRDSNYKETDIDREE